MLKRWILDRLAAVEDQPLVLLSDPLGLTGGMSNELHAWGESHGFAIIACRTNLYFRWRYEEARADEAIQRILILDQSSLARRRHHAAHQPAPPFYPDLVAATPPQARIELSLRDFLVQTTGDANWPLSVDEPEYARAIVAHLADVLRAHENLRRADPTRFADSDLHTIIACAALGVPQAAFKRLTDRDLWRVGLLGHEALQELERLAPEATRPIRQALGAAPAPFSWLEHYDPATVVRAFYLSAILAQHVADWQLWLGALDPALRPLTGLSDARLQEASSALVDLDPAAAARDLEEAEGSLDRAALERLLLEQMHLDQPEGFAGALERERYSTLVCSLALLMALENLLGSRPARAEQARVAAALWPEPGSAAPSLVERRASAPWKELKEAYHRAAEIIELRDALNAALKDLAVQNPEQLTFQSFWELWNTSRLNRLEYALSDLARRLDSADLLPRPEDELPSAFVNALAHIRQAVHALEDQVQRRLGELDARFEELVARRYPDWAHADGPVYLTAQFLRRCLKPHWDPQNEDAALFIFDGLRYELWDEFVRPMFLERMELVAELPAISILPSETHLSRKALSAGAFPEAFDSGAGEDQLLRDGLRRELACDVPVEAIAPEGSGTGETVRYRAGRLQVLIFELADRELHRLELRTLPDGRRVPARPLAYLYQQHLKDMIDKEVLAVVRSLPAGCKVFVTADHGFVRAGRERLWLRKEDLNENVDCNYRWALLRVPPEDADLPARVRESVIAFTPAQLRLRTGEEVTDSKSKKPWRKEYRGVLFPRVGYSLGREDERFNPPAYTHGGISLGELVIPMAVLRVRPHQAGLVILEGLVGPARVVEGEEVEFRVRLRPGAGARGEEVRVDLSAAYARDAEAPPLPPQVVYVGPQGAEAAWRFRPDPADATPEERRAGEMARTLTVVATYRDGRRTARSVQCCQFTVRLDTDRVVRRVGNLGNILGLTPKGMH